MPPRRETNPRKVTSDSLRTRPTNGDPSELIRLLDEDPDLARDVDRAASAARHAVIALVENVRPGPWQPAEQSHGSLGMLILDGFVTRSVLTGGLGCTELLGRGDLV